MTSPSTKRRVSYFYDGEFAQFYFGQNHPMKPHRLAMTHQLVLGYGLHKRMDVHRVVRAYPHELAQFHSQAYVDFLARITPDNAHLHPQVCWLCCALCCVVLCVLCCALCVCFVCVCIVCVLCVVCIVCFVCVVCFFWGRGACVACGCGCRCWVCCRV